MVRVEESVLRRAVQNVGTWGDTDVFPFPFENHIMHDREDEIVALLAEFDTTFDVSLNVQPLRNWSTLVPIGYTGYRWATQIEPIWNAYLLALVASLGDGIEGTRVSDEFVFSYRFREVTPDETGLFNVDGWRRFQAKSRQLAESNQYVVAVDIADFYSRIYHHRLENSLEVLDPGHERSNHIMTLLGILSNNTSYGLPVGGPAARLLAELLLDRVDKLILANPAMNTFCRYADDYRFFVDDVQAAHKVIGLLSEYLIRNEGLSLQKSKTRVMTSAEYLSVLDPPEPPRGSAFDFLGLHIHYDPYSATASEDYDRLKENLGRFDILDLLGAELKKGRIHPAVTRRLVQAMKFLEPDVRKAAILSLLDNLETLAPVIPQVMLAIRDSLVELDESFVSDVHRRIRGLIIDKNRLAMVELNLSYMIRVLASKREIESEQLLIQLYSAPHGFGDSSSPTIQRDIMLIMARWGVTYWIGNQKNYVGMADPWVKRAFIVASYVLGDEGAHWRSANKTSFTKYDSIVRDWAASKMQISGWQVPI